MTADPIFTPFRHGRLHLANRLVALPVFTGYAETDGRVSPLLRSHYQRLARSGVGLVIVANVAVGPDGITSPGNLRLDDDRYIAGLAGLAQAIHRGGALAGVQLNHAGRLALTEHPLVPAPLDATHLAFNITALKRFMDFFPFEERFGLTRRFWRQVSTWRSAMTLEMRQAVIEAFSRAAVRAAAAGFDVVELHGASGYLISQFLSAFSNPAVSEPGPGDLARRLAFPLALFERVRQDLDPRVPLGWRLMVREFVPRGIDAAQAGILARNLARSGAAYVSVSAGTFHSIFAEAVRRVTRRPAYLEADCAALRRDLGIPVVAAGRVATPAVARRLVASGQADLVGLGRALQADPGWLHKARRSRPVRVCLDCHWCLRRVVLDQGLGCVRWPRRRLARLELTRRAMARLGRWLWIVAAPQDIARYHERASLLGLGIGDEPAAAPVSVMFLDPSIDGPCREGFLDWICATFTPGAAQIAAPRPAAEPGLGDALVDQMRQQSFGGVVFCRDSASDWGRKLIYRPRGKVAVLLGRQPAGGPVLVPLDFSEAGLLQLCLLRRWLEREPVLGLDLVHVTGESPESVQRRWTPVCRIVGWPQTTGLEVAAPAGTVAATLIARARTTGASTVVLGKRGISGVKRLLLGSVSSAVLAGLAKATVVLVD
jgi:2,4-dienoyl-CoA reductase (NADPH2)